MDRDGRLTRSYKSTDLQSTRREENQNANDHGNENTKKCRWNIPNSFIKIRYNDLDFYERCDEGSYGSVYRGCWISQDQEVAVKKINALDKEAHVLSVISHRNIVQFFGACAEEPNFCIVTEYACHGNLFDFLASDSELGTNRLLVWARDIALGMNYLHKEAPVTVIHRDLKSKNVVICRNFVLKVCDFGASRFLSNTAVMTITGTYPWMAPELIQGLPTCEMCDVYSFGVVLWELLIREVPFKGLQGFQIAWAVVEKLERPLIPDTCPNRFANLMRQCWAAEVKKRPPFHNIIRQINIFLNDESLEEGVHRFSHDKKNWIKDIEKKEQNFQQQEKELQDLEDREIKLKGWHEKLLQELRKQTLTNVAFYNMKSEKISCKISGTGEEAVESVIDILDHLMSQRDFHSPKIRDSTPNAEFECAKSENSDTKKQQLLNTHVRPMSLSSGEVLPVTVHNPFCTTSSLQPQINSEVVFENLESSNCFNIASQPDYRSHCENASGTKLVNAFVNAPRIIQRQTSSSSEGYCFEGSKESCCFKNENDVKSSNANIKAEIYSWKDSKSDAKFPHKETFNSIVHEPDSKGRPSPNKRKLRPYKSLPNLFFHKLQNKVRFYLPSENDISKALSLMVMEDNKLKDLDKNFCKKLIKTLQCMYGNCTSDQDELENSSTFECDEDDIRTKHLISDTKKELKISARNFIDKATFKEMYSENRSKCFEQSLLPTHGIKKTNPLIPSFHDDMLHSCSEKTRNKNLTDAAKFTEKGFGERTDKYCKVNANDKKETQNCSEDIKCPSHFNANLTDFTGNRSLFGRKFPDISVPLTTCETTLSAVDETMTNVTKSTMCRSGTSTDKEPKINNNSVYNHKCYATSCIHSPLCRCYRRSFSEAETDNISKSTSSREDRFPQGLVSSNTNHEKTGNSGRLKKSLSVPDCQIALPSKNLSNNKTISTDIFHSLENNPKCQIKKPLPVASKSGKRTQSRFGSFHCDNQEECPWKKQSNQWLKTTNKGQSDCDDETGQIRNAENSSNSCKPIELPKRRLSVLGAKSVLGKQNPPGLQLQASHTFDEYVPSNTKSIFKPTRDNFVISSENGYLDSCTSHSDFCDLPQDVEKVPSEIFNTIDARNRTFGRIFETDDFTYIIHPERRENKSF
ncbi:uncharacterized protein LOC143453136 [Clavelina lepadiformis]|uniref:uncharacterized protein LOC143453136 n=1 Tax=Clavelina lepadiformis TaxID=159417 RepID=UPI004042DF11